MPKSEEGGKEEGNGSGGEEEGRRTKGPARKPPHHPFLTKASSKNLLKAAKSLTFSLIFFVTHSNSTNSSNRFSPWKFQFMA